jgi:stage V sporulation protein R
MAKQATRKKTPSRKRAPKRLFDGPDWTFETMQATYEAIETVALEELGLDLYPNQIEVISSEQMLDAYASTGMPLMYKHWSFGKTFLGEERNYRKGRRGLAYEIIINSNPCISYNMEDNTMAMQTLVMAHAAFGHNHFFKNNHVFRMWTDAEGILDYLEYARNFVAQCEEQIGRASCRERV